MDCAAYSEAQVKKCAALTSSSACLNEGSVVASFSQDGMGHALARIRAQCAAAYAETQQPCVEMLVSDWVASSSCVWCPEPGAGALAGGNGQCVAPSDSAPPRD